MNQPPLSPPPPPELPKSSALAIWSLVLGVLSLPCFSILTGIPAVICGHIAKSRINASGGRLTGSGLALAGLITGYLSIVLSIVLVPMMIAIAIPSFVKAKAEAQKVVCIGNLRQIEGAKQQWAQENKKQPTDSPTAADLDPYLKSGFSSLVCPAGGTYAIKAAGETPTCSVAGHQLP
jgi:hypothetical protein